MNVVVTGGTGFLGSHLVERLIADGYDVTFTGRQLKTPAPQRSRFEAIDLLDEAGLNRVMKDAELVFHAAALSSPWGRAQDFIDANTIGTSNVVAACLQQGVERIVHVSTPSIYVDGRDRLMVEEAEPLPAKAINMYAYSKRLAEEVIERASAELAVITVRPRAIIGAGDSAIFPRFIAALRTGRLPIIGSGDNLADLSHVANVVDALLLCAHADNAHLGRVYNISNDAPVRLWDVIRQVAERLGLPVPSRRLPYRLAYGIAASLEAIHATLIPAKEPRLTRYGVTILGKSMTLDISAAKRDLGYAPRISMEQGLEQVLELYGRADGQPRG